MKPRVMIATPVYGRIVPDTSRAIMATIKYLAERGVEAVTRQMENSLIAVARNALATEMLRDGYTHMFAVDSDMLFGDDLCWRMLRYDKPILGTVAAEKRFSLDRMKSAFQNGASFEEAYLFGFHWLHFANVDPIVVGPDGLTEANSIGLGVALIQRQAFETIIDKCGLQPRPLSNLGPLYNFFGERLEDVQNSRYRGEDLSFSDRWCKDCGQRLWVLADAKILHIGDFHYGGNYLDYLRAIARMNSKVPVETN